MTRFERWTCVGIAATVVGAVASVLALRNPFAAPTPTPINRDLDSGRLYAPKPIPPSIKYEVSKYVAEDASATDVYVTVTGELHNPVFQVKCDVECEFLKAQFVGGASKFDRPGPEPATTIEGRFIIPSVMKEGDQVVFRLGSYKPEPPKVVSVTLISALSRADNQHSFARR